MRKIRLTMKEEEKYKIIKNVVEGKYNKFKAEVRLGITRRHLNRLILKYKQEGKMAFQHGNRNKKPSHSIEEILKEKIIQLYTEKYSKFNFTHFTEKLNDIEEIKCSRTTVSMILKAHHIISPKAWRKTKNTLRKQLRQQLKQTQKKKEGKILLDKIDTLDISSAHPSRPRKKYFGEQIQMDGSLHDWFGTGEKATLHVAIDDASGHVVGAWFEKEETLKGYYTIFHQILTKYGIPNEFKTDRRTIFEYESKSKKQIEEDTFTQFNYACKQLGVTIKASSIPQTKGRVERVFGTLQSRLVAEFDLNKITSITDANEFLNSYIKKFNQRFGLPLNHITSIFEKTPSPANLNIILGVLSHRKIDAGHHFRFQNEYYLPITSLGNEKYFSKRTKVLVIKAFDGHLFVSIGDELFATKRLDKHEKQSKEFDSINTKLDKPKRIYIPPMNHPWKYNSFIKYLQKRGLTQEEFDIEKRNRNIM